MSVIAIVQTAHRVYRIANQLSKRAVRGDSYDRYVTKFPPNYRPYVRDILRGADIAFSGGLISEAIEYGLSGISPSIQQPGQKRQTRSYMDKPFGKRFKSKSNYDKYCRPRSRQRYRN